MADTREILKLAVEIADQMLRNGAELYRVEDSVIHMLEAYEIENFDVYVLSNGIFASANEDQDDACSMVRHVPLGSTNLGKVASLNQLTRDVCEHRCTVEEAYDRIEMCKKQQGYSYLGCVAACAIGCGAFSYMFGGTWFDAFFALAIGGVEQVFLTVCQKHKVSRFIKNVSASMIVASLGIVLLLLNIHVHYDKVIIGAVMPIVPGIVFTNSIREFHNGDYLSGTIHLIDALLTALCIAVGIAIPIYLSQMQMIPGV